MAVNQKVTIKDVAKQSGVSITTVSQILNGHFEKFSQETIQNVKYAQKKLHYQPNSFAQQMVTKESKTIGIIVPNLINPFFSHLLNGLESNFYKEHYLLLLCTTQGNKEKETNYLDELNRRGVDAIIVISSSITKQEIKQFLTKNHLPILLLDQQQPSFSLESDIIQTDDFLGGKLAAQHLKEYGHKKVAYILPQHAPFNVLERKRGFLSVFPHAIPLYGELTKEGGLLNVTSLLSLHCTAVLAMNDEIAFGLYKGLKEKKYKIPKDMSIIGYDNTEMCEYVTPPLTTIEQPIFQLGQKAATFILNRIKFPNKKQKEVSLSVKLIKRSSVARLQ